MLAQVSVDCDVGAMSRWGVRSVVWSGVRGVSCLGGGGGGGGGGMIRIAYSKCVHNLVLLHSD